MDIRSRETVGPVVMDEADLSRVLTRISHEILEQAKGPADLVILGIPTRGALLAQRIAHLVGAAEDAVVPVGSLDITMYRDDLNMGPARALGHTEIPVDGIDGRTVILVDDVLFSGRTVRAALDAINDIGRPSSVRLAVLVDRGHRELPIRADHVGKNLPTNKGESVRLRLKELDGVDEIVLLREEVAEMRKHLLSASDLTLDDAVLVLDTAAEMENLTDRSVKKLPALRGRTVVNLFFEDSTRTRISFEAAAKRLSADVINFSAKASSVSKGETLKDTALTLEAMGADAVVIRHSASGAPYRLATSGWIDAAVVNAGDGKHEHPTQALLDAYTMRKHLRGNTGDLSGLKVLLVGDVLHSRVARSNVTLLNTLGAHVTLVAPPTLLPVGVEEWPVSVSYNLDEQIELTDVVMMLRVQRERMNEAYFPTTREYSRWYGLDDNRVARLPKESLIMHPGPMNRGLEIGDAVADSDRSVIVEQVANGVTVRMAVLYLLVGGAGPVSAAEQEPGQNRGR